MDGLFALVVLLFLFMLLGAITGFMAFGRVRKLERNVEELKARLDSNLVKSEQLGAADEIVPDSDETAPETAHEAGAVEASELAKMEADEAVHSELPQSESPEPSEQDDKKPGFSLPFGGGKAKSGRNLEETIGSLWAVWIGGLALALGALFLVKFSIDRGLLGPGVRILLGGLFSASLIGLGEWARRRGEAFSFTGFSKANIPAILSAAGTMGAFATIYAAYELYGMLSPLVAFILLGMVSVATTFAALLHGPLLAVLGIIASFAAPLLITTQSPSLPGLSLYVLAVAASGFVVGRLRLWKWLAVTVASGLIFYGLLMHSLNLSSLYSDRLTIAAFIIASWCMVTYVFVISLYEKSPVTLVKYDVTASILSALVMTLLLGSASLKPADTLSAGLLLAVVVGSYLIAYYFSVLRAGIYSAMVIAGIGYLGWSIDFTVIDYMAGITDVDTLLADFRVRGILSMFTWVGVMLAAAAAIIGFIGVKISASRVAFAIGGAFLPLMVFCINYIRVEDFSSSWSYAFVALAMFVGFLAISNFIYNKVDGPEAARDGASAAYAIAAFVALILSVSLVLEKAALTIALALLVPVIAYVYNKRPLPGLRVLTVLASSLWIGRVLWDPTIVDGNIGTTPIFNWLTYGYGIPTAGFALAASLLGRSGRDQWLEAMEAIALASFVATLGLVGLHAIDPGEVFTAIDTLEEAALVTIIGAGVALGLLLIKRTRTAKFLNLAVTGLGYAGMASAALYLLGLYNPWYSNESFGDGWILNGLLFAYIFPAILFLALGYYARGRRPDIYVNGALTLSALLIVSWVNLSIRHIYHPVSLQSGATSDAELYTYSVVWLLIGIAVLVAGIVKRNKRLRMVSVGILVLVVAKVFLIDMAGLEGILRALSFIGLGATLIGIGLVYQRVLSRPDYADEVDGADEADEADGADGADGAEPK